MFNLVSNGEEYRNISLLFSL